MIPYINLKKEQFLSWEHRKTDQQKTISYPSEYEGFNDLRIACTQLNLSPSKQKRLIADWCAFLPTLNNVEKIFFYSRMPQVLFEATCKMTNLSSLFIKWSGNGITDFTSIGNLKSLRRLYIGSCTQLETFKPFSRLESLEWLELHELKKVNNIEPISKLTKLLGLTFTGGMFGKQIILTLEPLVNLSKLEYLNISSLYAESDGLLPIARLNNLKHLDTPIYYDMSDFAKVFVALPNCDHGIAAYRKADQKCGKCDKGELVYPMSKNRRKLCTVCNSDKIENLKKEFSDLVSEYT